MKPTIHFNSSKIKWFSNEIVSNGTFSINSELFESLFGFVHQGHQTFSNLKAITPSSLLFNTFISFFHKIFHYNSFEILIGFQTYLRLVEGAELVLPATTLPSAMSLLGSASHTTVFLQLLSNVMNSCNICQTKVILLTRSLILNYSLGKNVHQQEAKLQSNCHLLKLSFLKKSFPFLNNIKQLILTLFYIASSNFKTQNPSFELGKILQKHSWTWEKSGNFTWTRHWTNMERWYSSGLWSRSDSNRESNNILESIFLPNISLRNSAYQQQLNRINPRWHFPWFFYSFK